MRSHIVISSLFASAASLSTASRTESGYLATVSLAPTATGAAALDLEDKRAECFQACYETYGNYKSCTRRGEDKLAECWCNDSVDWVEREEDCVWDICGVSAYNLYGDVLKRVCQTVTASSSTSSEMILTVSLYLKSF
ncbi:hypothetical protein BKA59DRAFT_236900 [Fusarium tricinctum]|uniref:Extracellular membrane protein CFEM domain-containing protein n=1 Tax=Fusarium tricinctum TaxID=61284 RepID=A0A8K0RPY6_9HYPO|nr:hypothetical protein BKA59DRAFT_236900 [Fusarium tricinctum]